MFNITNKKKDSSILNSLKEQSLAMVDKIKADLKVEFNSEEPFYNNICIYACGSLGRLEMSSGSDLDLFFILKNYNGHRYEYTNIEKYCFFAHVNKVSSSLGFPPPSKGGMYWDFIAEEDLKDIGSRKEDYNNSLTARILLLLESKPLYNEEIYDSLIKEIVLLYFTDYKDHPKDFYPMFLMNDILRYWYTLTLNYEYRRDDSDKITKKYWKRLKLKFSRLLTCFSLLACLYQESISPDDVIAYVKMTPFERLYTLAESDSAITGIIEEIEQEYKWFIELRINSDDSWWDNEDNKTDALQHADKFHEIFIHKLMKYVSEKNKNLKSKMDLY